MPRPKLKNRDDRIECAGKLATTFKFRNAAYANDRSEVKEEDKILINGIDAIIDLASRDTRLDTEKDQTHYYETFKKFYPLIKKRLNDPFSGISDKYREVLFGQLDQLMDYLEEEKNNGYRNEKQHTEKDKEYEKIKNRTDAEEQQQLDEYEKEDKKEEKIWYAYMKIKDDFVMDREAKLDDKIEKNEKAKKLFNDMLKGFVEESELPPLGQPMGDIEKTKDMKNYKNFYNSLMHNTFGEDVGFQGNWLSKSRLRTGSTLAQREAHAETLGAQYICEAVFGAKCGRADTFITVEERIDDKHTITYDGTSEIMRGLAFINNLMKEAKSTWWNSNDYNRLMETTDELIKYGRDVKNHPEKMNQRKFMFLLKRVQKSSELYTKLTFRREQNKERSMIKREIASAITRVTDCFFCNVSKVGIDRKLVNHSDAKTYLNILDFHKIKEMEEEARKQELVSKKVLSPENESKNAPENGSEGVSKPIESSQVASL